MGSHAEDADANLAWRSAVLFRGFSGSVEPGLFDIWMLLAHRSAEHLEL